MACRVSFKKSVGKDLNRLGRAEAERVLMRLAEELPERAHACPELKGRFSGLRKFRVGECRVIFAILNETILMTRIGHRRDAYRES
ncbi:type II toxin-antitoxin system RelE/ParE family toxin [Candidatus Fermentibacteria bacterium]|nr:type II toxin-antitoxin system RelE/ParE family toxin [Candidatus Fermentibacteria bacterium]